MSDSLRLFAAVPLPGSISYRLSQWSLTHRADYPFQKWTHEDDLHITLFFLGETAKHRVSSITDSLRDAASRLSPIPLRLGGLGTFGPPAAPSILWTGVIGELEPLKALHRLVKERLTTLGFAADNKPYRPHITLARRYKGQRPWTAVKDKLLAAPLAPQGMEWICDRFTLYISHLDRTPMYEALEEFPFTETIRESAEGRESVHA